MAPKNHVIAVVGLLAVSACGDTESKLSSSQQDPTHYFEPYSGQLAFTCTTPEVVASSRNYVGQPMELFAGTDVITNGRVLAFVHEQNGDAAFAFANGFESEPLLVGPEVVGRRAYGLRLAGLSVFVWKEQTPEGNVKLVTYNVGLDSVAGTSDDSGRVVLDYDVDPDASVVVNGAWVSWDDKRSSPHLNYCSVSPDTTPVIPCTYGGYLESPAFDPATYRSGFVAYSILEQRTVAVAEKVDSQGFASLEYAFIDGESNFQWSPFLVQPDPSQAASTVIGDIALNLIYFGGETRTGEHRLVAAGFEPGRAEGQPFPITPWLPGDFSLLELFVTKDIFGVLMSQKPLMTVWFDDQNRAMVTEIASAPEPFALPIDHLEPTATPLSAWVWGNYVLLSYDTPDGKRLKISGCGYIPAGAQ